MGNDPPEELNDENSKSVQVSIKKSLEGLKEIAEELAFTLFFAFTISSFALAKTDIAIITNQEANIVDIID